MTNAEKIVQTQLDAYNNKDLEGWLNTYAENATQYSTDGELLAFGHEQMARNMRVRFAEPDLYANLINRIVCDNVVIDHELITRNFPEGKGTIEMLCIYHIENNLIQKGQFKVFNKQIFTV
ncbi:nuclear transport factor 2 family protein [Pseudoalteromonas sp. S16_S37]|uniref:nuclear transport factor 2 family protein n=1 Tax=Pseudoalteromonas sp. S16_S37 TaxID=2720228 RepID=UPI001680A1CE|nr:nuclear transport factor 2 family protein [Pseudoalteromonas sp. S16_S37]MBD1584036.1 SnoaL-like domain-containing protein [Pseudoalteromonas sp. S16_S37]